MQHKVGRDDLRQAAQLFQRQMQWDQWWRCDDYEVREGQIVAAYPPPKEVELDSPPSHWHAYRPLEHAPELFFKLASLYEAKNFQEASLAFARKYGVPGGSSVERGGTIKRMSLTSFRWEAWRAWIILKMYEAVLNRDDKAAESLLVEHYPRAWVAILEGATQHPSEERPWAILLGALVRATIMMNDTLRATCSPGLFYTQSLSWPEPDLTRVVGGWKFDNLLGAAYLQMFWLMGSTDQLARCEYCGRIISLARPYPEGRKRRRDKRFCDDACRQAHHRSRKKP